MAYSQSRAKHNAWKIPLLILVIGMVPAVPGIFSIIAIIQNAQPGHPLAELVQPRYLTAPLPILVHIFGGIVFYAIAPLQFIGNLRVRCPRFHRMAGRIAFVGGFVYALTALPLLLDLPPGPHALKYWGLGFSGISVAICLSLSLWHAIKRNISAHQLWIYRAIAIGLAGATRAVLDILALTILGELLPIHEGIIMWLGLSINLVLLECIWRKNRSFHNVPKNKFTRILSEFQHRVRSEHEFSGPPRE